MTKTRLNFLKGFAVGFALIAFSTFVPIITEQKQINFASIGWWVDTLVQAIMVGVLIGAGASWVGREKSS